MKIYLKALDWAIEGRRHGIPWCCALRFGFSAARPKLFSALGLPRLSARLYHLGPRYIFADEEQGIVPCELHLPRYILRRIRMYLSPCR